MAGKIVICPKCNEKIEEKFRIEKQKLLIVEGRDEEEFFTALLRQLGITDIQVAGIGGKYKLRVNLKTLKTTEPLFAGVNSLGIIRDADDDHQSAFVAVQDALNAAGLPCPRRPLTPVGASPKVTIMILPPSTSRGALEDVCLELVRDDPAMSCVDDFFHCLDEKAIGRPGKDFNKAKVKVFLASREDPTLRLGEAAGKGYWPFSGTCLDEVRDFLRAL